MLLITNKVGSVKEMLSLTIQPLGSVTTTENVSASNAYAVSVIFPLDHK